MRWLAALLMFAVACESGPLVVPSPSISPTARVDPGGTGQDVWAYSGTLLRPPDPSIYANVIDAAVALRDGGWLVLRQETGRRNVPVIGTGGGLFRKPVATLVRLDARGVEVAREHGSEPFALQELRAFEDLGLVIGYGAQVVNGSIHAFDLATLDGLWTVADRDPVPCVPIADRCWTYRRSTAPTDTTVLTERDARTYRPLRTFHHLGMDGVGQSPGIYPALNTVVWNEPGGPIAAGRARAERLELDRPPATWASRVDAACYANPVRSTHLMLRTRDCSVDIGGSYELLEIATGRTVATWPEGQQPGIDSRNGELTFDDALVDLATGGRGPDLPAEVLWLDDSRGVAAVRLTNGGAAVYRRATASGGPLPVSGREIARVQCAGLDFAIVAEPRDRDGRCPELAGHAGTGRLLVTRGRVPTGEELTITGILADNVTRELKITFAAGTARRAVPLMGVGRVIELPGTIRGEWLVRLQSPGISRTALTFVVDIQ